MAKSSRTKPDILTAVGTYGRGAVPFPEAKQSAEPKHDQQRRRRQCAQVDGKESHGEQQEAIAHHIKPKSGAVAAPELLGTRNPAQQRLRAERLGQALSSQRLGPGRAGELARGGCRRAELLRQLASPSAIFLAGLSLLVGQEQLGRQARATMAADLRFAAVDERVALRTSELLWSAALDRKSVVEGKRHRPVRPSP